ncbi:MAG: primosomal protein N', partial [Bacilli bacterium]|nr:primosomal protein N' [Bacilli bacterium]
NELKDIIDVVDKEPILNTELLELGKYMQSITLSTLISCYQTMLPSALKAKNGRNINKKMDTYVVLDDLKGIKYNDKQRLILDTVLNNGKVLKSRLSMISSSSLKTLINKGVLKEEKEEVYRLDNHGDIKEKHLLTKLQEDTVDRIMDSKDSSKVFLIHGVTGSGKTEIYMEIIEKLLSEDKESIMLVPEISLTEQIVSRFKNRFKESIAILHSRLSEGEKYDEWRRIARGEVKIVIGARSAIFAPLSNIGVIVIDEEHTDSYKQDGSNPKYHALDIAKWRSNYHKCPIILGSATPTLESYARSKKGVYELITLSERVNGKSLPSIKIVDMNKEMKRKNGSFSKELIDSMNESFSKNEQVILLLNRRGYSSFVLCKNCGYTEKCPNCDISLTYHKSSNTLRCHYCGYGTKLNKVCPSCHDEAMSTLGTGTEKIEEELSKLFPDKKVIRMDYDTTSRKGSHEKIITSFGKGEYDILLGTQMIAKGLDFPNVTLVGVINADTSLNIPDFRSSENTFDLLCQVAGRSGRGEKSGKVIIQTFNPDHYAINCVKSHDYVNFYEKEMSIRHRLGYPPYYYLTSIKIASKDYEVARDISNKISLYLNNNLENTTILGPSVAAMFKVNNVYRFQII